jgi:hypothetical protein
MSVSDGNTCKDDNDENIVVPEERSIWKRDPCVVCKSTYDMLRVDENNRICDICEKGPICYGCYKGEWLDPCVCKKCRETTPLTEIAKLSIDGKYKPRFYKPNIQPVCVFCTEKHATFSCNECGEVQCDNCVGRCRDCNILLCGSCGPDVWSESQCIQCGDSDYDPDNDPEEEGKRGKSLTTWTEVRLQHPFGHFWK